MNGDNGTGHVVAVFGGAVAGAEATGVLAEAGHKVIVFEQNVRPYGKIEDGLPRWHVKQRRQEYEKIGKKLIHPNVTFVPKTRLGDDVGVAEVMKDWGFSAVLMATGSWRDRPLPVEGIDAYVGKGLYYQNPFVYWFNHYGEAEYDGPPYEAVDGAIVVGGGLASIDVVKILQIETVQKGLAKRGIEVDMHTLETKGIAKILEDHGLTLDALGLQGCTLYYRRRPIDMPLATPPDNATPEQEAKTQQVRQKILDNAMKKYLFRFQGNRSPVGAIVENGRLVGLRWQETRIEGRKVVPVEGAFHDVRSPLAVSSIGSIPEPIEGIPMKWELFECKDLDTGEIDGLDGLFLLGNAVTGKGNIRVSRKHGEQVAKHVAANYLAQKPALSAEKVSAIEDRVAKRHAELGYDGYAAWIERHPPWA